MDRAQAASALSVVRGLLDDDLAAERTPHSSAALEPAFVDNP